MHTETLEQKLSRLGNPARMLRAQNTGYYAFPMQPEFTNWRDEQRAWTTTAVLFDQSHHMWDVYFEGPDVKRLMPTIGLNSFQNFGANKAKQLIGCNEEGFVVGDAILFAWSESKVSLVGAPVLANWAQSQAERNGYDVEITRDNSSAYKAKRLLFRYQLQGPNALAIIENAHGGPVNRIKFFNTGEFTIAGVRVRALNHTMTGVPGQEMTGLEMTGPFEQGPRVLEALVRAGHEVGMELGGAISYSTTAVESGWIGMYVPAIFTSQSTRPHRDWLPGNGFEGAASLGGSYVSDDIRDYYLTPWDLGYGHILRFDHDFIGRDALEKMRDQPHRQKVWLIWNDEDVARVMASGLFGGQQRAKYMQAPNAAYVMWQFDEVRVGDRLVGLSNRNSYTVNIGHWASIAILDEAEAQDGTTVTLIWGEPDGGAARDTTETHVQVEIRATVRTQPPA